MRNCKNRIELIDDGNVTKETINELGVKHSLYFDMYKEILNAILQHVNISNEYVNDHDKDEYMAAYKYYNLQNIFAIIGERGTGKTTALYEILHILNNFDKKTQKWSEILKKENISNVVFHVLPNIDASLLDDEEDLLELIWANLYEEIERKNRGNMGRFERDETIKNIVEELDNLYKNYLHVGANKEGAEASVLERLRKVPSSIKAKKSFDDLVKIYLKLIYDNETNICPYLVISVDDLDLNLKNGYQILEQLYKYLTHPNVIILLSVDIRQLAELGNKYLWNSMTPDHSFPFDLNMSDYYEGTEHSSSDIVSDIRINELELRRLRTVMKLCDDNMLKMIAQANRFYMPESKQIYRDCRIRSNDKYYTIKEFILYKIAEKTNISYDALGLKQHFCLPTTIRGIVNYIDFLESLESIKPEDGMRHDINYWNNIKVNHERILRDINERMTLKVLTQEQRVCFKLINERNISRRAEYAINFLLGRQTGQISETGLPDNVEDMEYCYSNLLEQIYKTGRKNYYDKALIHCILASLTVEISNVYCDYKAKDKTPDVDQPASVLDDYLGNTFGGSWYEDCYSKVLYSTREIKITNDASGDIKKYEMITDKYYNLYGFKRGKINDFQCSIEINTMQDNLHKNVLNNVFDLVPYLECAMMLFYDFSEEKKEYNISNNVEMEKSITPQWVISIPQNHALQTENRKETRSYTVNLSIEQKDGLMIWATFDIFGFIGKELNSPNKNKYREDIIQNITNMMLKAKASGKYELLNMISGNSIRQSVFNKSIWAENSTISKNLYFPFYNLDLSYNVMKRVRRKMLKSNILDSKTPSDYLRRVYGFMAEELYKEDLFYNKNKEKKSNLYNDFIRHPFIKRIGFKSEYHFDGGVKCLEKNPADDFSIKIFNDILNSIFIDFENQHLHDAMNELDF